MVPTWHEIPSNLRKAIGLQTRPPSDTRGGALSSLIAAHLDSGGEDLFAAHLALLVAHLSAHVRHNSAPGCRRVFYSPTESSQHSQSTRMSRCHKSRYHEDTKDTQGIADSTTKRMAALTVHRGDGCHAPVASAAACWCIP
eukprot:180473-Pyramimonas_sp.AAC.1